MACQTLFADFSKNQLQEDIDGKVR